MDIKSIFFDTSDTLYSSPALEEKIKSAPIDFIIEKKGVNKQDALKILEDANTKANKKGILLTKSNVLKEAGFENSDWQNFIAKIDTKLFLTPIQKNIDTLNYLSTKYELGIITNINNKFLQNILETLGFSNNLFSYFITSDDTAESKPSLMPFSMAIDRTKLLPEQICYIGDDIKKDMEPARKVGMKTILIDYKNLHENSLEKTFDYRIKNLDELNNLL